MKYPFTRHLLETRPQETSTAAETVAATAGTAGLGVVAAATTVAGTAVHQLVTEPAAGRALVRAHEDTGVHIGGATSAVSGFVNDVRRRDRATLHVDLSRNVVRAVDARESVLQPSLVQLAVDHAGVREDGSTCARRALSVGHGDLLTGAHGLGDQRLDGVDPGTSGTPAEEDEVLAGVVGEFVLVGTVSAEPSVVVFGVAVGAHLCAEALHGRENGALADAVKKKC